MEDREEKETNERREQNDGWIEVEVQRGKPPEAKGTDNCGRSWDEYPH